MYIKAQITNQSIFFNFKSPLLYVWCIYVVIPYNRCLFLQVDNLNLATNLKNYCFYAMLITYKCTPFDKKTRLQCKKWTTLPCNHPLWELSFKILSFLVILIFNNKVCYMFFKILGSLSFQLMVCCAYKLGSLSFSLLAYCMSWYQH
jgi:hypothetical protein